MSATLTHAFMYFVVPCDLYFTYKRQPYHAKDGKLFNGHVGDGEVEQWALMILTGGGEKPAPGKDQECHAGTKRQAD